MKRLIRAANQALVNDIILPEQIVSIVLVDDVNEFRPRDRRIFADSRHLQYNDMTREQLLQLPSKELSKLTDVAALRKLKFEELTPAQQIIVDRANRNKIQDVSIKQVKEILQKLKECYIFHIDDSDKNNTFMQEIYEKGGRVQDTDAEKIIHQLHLRDFVDATYSYLTRNWNALLVIFRFKGPYTFAPLKPGGDPVTEENLELYVKIDIDTRTERGYCVMSLHRPEGKMNPKFPDYPIENE